MSTNNNDTIVTLATPRGESVLNIVRISGENALNIALLLSKKETFIPRRATLSKVYDPKDGNIIDETLILYFIAPYSFTGEDIIEIQCHGGMGVVNILLDRVLLLGARLAEAGEFTKRAFLNHKMDLTKAEAIANIIQAKSEEAVKLLARQLRGDLQTYVDTIREDLLFVLACSEVGIDYADEDLPPDLIASMKHKLAQIKTNLEQTIQVSKRRDGLIDGYKIAIVGKPNVGKSSLLNSLLSYERAIVSNIAGTTRDTIEETIKIGTHIIKIVDTAGIRDTSNEIEKIGIERSLKAIEECSIVVALFDGSRPKENDDNEILGMLSNSSDKQIIYAINKADIALAFDLTNFDQYIQISCKENIQPLIDELLKILDNTSSEDTMTLVSKRQILCVEATLNNLILAIDFLQTEELEFFSHHIKEAIKEIANITRPFDNDQMLDVMFTSFCLGK